MTKHALPLFALLFGSLLASCAGSEVDSRDPRANATEITNLPTSTVFYLTDHQDTPVVLADARGAVIERRAAHGYGAERIPGDGREPWNFTGNELDATELGNFHVRPYDARQARFLAPDPEPLFNPNARIDPRAFGSYTYAAGDPVNLSDPSGESLWTKLIKVGTKLWKTGNAVDAFADNIQDAVTVFDSSAATSDRLIAGISLASELLPASIGDVKDVGRYVGVLGDAKRVERAADAASLEKRAKEIHSVLDARAQRARTTAVTEAVAADGSLTTIVTSSERRLAPAQRKALKAGEVEGVGAGHAEVTGVQTAERMGLSPRATAASRPICENCAGELDARGVSTASELKK